ncbi:MAG TPA: NADH-quinone oxidoreductase subunit J [Gemmataceae bacterium]|jgi:NADH-quinone oxidoreductase subunit J|nr:NADH-quinone oxidoreductase subunit J [Gemmataceae bacterium]
MELNAVLFYVLAVLTGACAVAVVVTGNIVRAAAWLLFALAGTAGVFFLLNADFVGATQLLVYVGGTLVLVVFGVMLTAQGPFITMRIGAAEWAIGLGVGLVLYAVLALSLVRTPPPVAPPEGPVRMPNSLTLAGAFLGSTAATPPAALTGVDKEAFPNGIVPSRTRVAYLLPFEIVSVHLLVVLIGAAYLARAKRRRGASS